MYLNSTQSEKLIIDCFDQEKMWDPEKWGDAIFYRGTMRSDRDSDSGFEECAHLFDFETDKQLSDREREEAHRSLINHFVPEGDRTGQITCWPSIVYTGTFKFVHNRTGHELDGHKYEIIINYFMDI